MSNCASVAKLRIGVFMGGKSIEHEVSFNSGRTVCDHLDSTIYDIIPIYQAKCGDLYILPYRFLHRGKTSDFSSRLSRDAEKISYDDLKKLVDFLYLAVHGRYAEDGTMQGMLDVLGIPFLGSDLFSCSLSMNKAKQKKFLGWRGVDVPKGIYLDSSDVKSITSKDNLGHVLGLLKKENLSNPPYIIKPSSEGSSLGVSAVFSHDDLLDAIRFAAFCDPQRIQSVLIEEKLEGMEFVCIHVEQKNIDEKIRKEEKSWMAFPITEIVPEKDTHFFDYEQKYMPGRATKIVPARCSKEDTIRIRETCLKTTKILDFSTISRIDGFLTKDGRVIITDSNAITGMGPSTFIFHQAAEFGMSHTELINYLIETDLHRYGLSKNILGLKDKKDMEDINNSKIRVAVLLGGETNEREISLESGRNVCYKLSPHKYDITPLFVNNKMELFKLSQKLLVKNSTKEIRDVLTPKIQIKWSDLPRHYDFIFIALHGGKGEGGSVQGTLEMLGLPYNGSGVFASSLCMDKYKTNHFLKEHGFDVPNSKLIKKEEWSSLKSKDGKIQHLNGLVEGIGFPIILKPYDEGCSFFVQKIKTVEELVCGLEDYFKTGKSTAMVEEYINAFELTCGVIGNDEVTALPPSQPIVSEEILSIKEKFLPGAGENQTPANLPKKTLSLVMKTMEKVYKCIGCKGYSRIDCFYQDASQSKTGKERVIILEINTLPGITPATCIFHQAAEVGIKPMEFVDKIVELGIENHKQNVNLNQATKDQKFKSQLS